MPSDTSMPRRRFCQLAALGAAAPLALGPAEVFAAGPAVAQVAGGALRGRARDGVVSFLGVPYAAPTEGANRFRAPQPAPTWTGERDATAYGPIAPQEVSPTTGVLAGWYEQDQPIGEDCCVLNVFTPDLDGTARRPVMVYIHGGGYINGGGGGEALDGSTLARFGDVVVVTINHRLNAFGYTTLAHLDPEGFGDAANAGHLDILAALRWVRDNATAFGGNPDNVTVFGQSGGGSKIMVLLGMPEAEGLFHRAISMSGAAGLNVDPAEEMVPYVDALLTELGVDPSDLGALQRVSMEEVLAARARAVEASGLDGARPVIDGRHVLHRPMSPEGLAVQAKVPLLLGHTKTEASLFFQRDMRNFAITEDQMHARLRQGYALDDAGVEAIVAAYRADELEMTPAEILVAVASDVQFRLPLVRAAETKSAAAGQAPVWLYNFAWTVPRDGGVLGSPHAVDIPFAFGTVDAAGEMTGPGPGPQETALNMMSAFVAFARSGDPNNDRMPDWRPYDAETRISMTIDATCEPAGDWRGAAREAAAGLRIDPFNRAALYRYEA